MSSLSEWLREPNDAAYSAASREMLKRTALRDRVRA